MRSILGANKHLTFYSIGCAAFLSFCLPALPQDADLLAASTARPPLGIDAFNGLALANNPSLRQAGALVARSKAQASQSGLWPNPSAGYQGEQLRGGEYGGGEQGAFLQQTFVLGGKLGLRKNIYRQQQKAGEIGLVEQRARLLGDIGQRFYSALAAQQSTKLQQQLLSIATDAVATARQLQNVGQADLPDVLQSEVEADQAALQYTAAQRLYLQEFSRLAALVGKPDLPLAPLAGDLGRTPEIDPDQLIIAILRDSPPIRRARQEVTLAEAVLKAARREKIPDLTLRAGVQQNNELLASGSTRVVGAQGFASAGVSLPLFNRNQGNVAAASADLERARAEVTRVELSLRQTVQSLLQQYLTDRLRAVQYRDRILPKAERAFELYLAKYRNMASAYPQVLVSQRTFFQLRTQYIQILQNIWQQAVALQNYALSDGLGAPLSSSVLDTNLNPPNSSAGALQ